MDELTTAALVGFVVTSATLPPLIWLLRRREILDLPNNRSSHKAAIPRGAGLALALGIAAVLLATSTFALAAWVTVIGFTAVGAWDDVSSLSVRPRLAAQAALAAAASVLLLVPLGRNLLYWTLPCAILVVAVTNAANFMDGINGISGLHAALWGVTYAIMVAGDGLTDWSVLGVALTATAIAFLPWNIVKARVFLGDSGSYLIGGIVGVFAICATVTIGLIPALIPLSIYAADTSVVLVRRFARHERLGVAHHEHVYQRMLEKGWGHLRTAIVTSLFTGSCCALALLDVHTSGTWRALSIVGAFAACLAYLTMPTWSRARSAQTPRGRNA